MAENEIDVSVRLDPQNKTAADAERIRRNTDKATQPSATPEAAKASPFAPDGAKNVRLTNDELGKLRSNLTGTESQARSLATQLEGLGRRSTIPAVAQQASQLAAQIRAQADAIRAASESTRGGIGLGVFSSDKVKELQSLSNGGAIATARLEANRLREHEASVLSQVAGLRSGVAGGAAGAAGAVVRKAVVKEAEEAGEEFGLKFAARFALTASNLPGPDRFVDKIVRRLDLGTIAAVGIVGAAAFGVYEIAKAYEAAQERALKFEVSAHDSGQALSNLTGYAADFRAQIIGTYEDAQKLASALGGLETAAGGGVKTGALTTAISTITNARGLSADDAAKLVGGISKGDTGAYQALTGRSGELALDRYAKSIGTTVARLTQMQKAQVLANGVIKESGAFADIAARRVSSLSGTYAGAKNNLSDFLSDYADAFVETFSHTSYSPGATYKRKLRDLGADANNDEVARQFRAAKDAQDEAKTKDSQQRAANSYDYKFGELANTNFGQGIDAASRKIATYHFLLTDLYFDQDKLSADEYAKRHDEAAKSYTDAIRQFEQFQEQAQDKLRTLGREASTALSGALERQHADNPFVKFFGDADRAIEETQRKFAALGPEITGQLTAAQRAAQAMELQTLRLDTALSASKSLNEARTLSQPIIGLSGPETRTQAIVDAAARAAVEARKFDDDARNLLPNRQGRSAGDKAFDDRNLLAAQLKELLALRAQYGGTGAYASRAALSSINKQILGITGSIDPSLFAAGDPIFRQAGQERYNALRGSAEESRAEVRDAVERAKAGERIQADVREDLKLIAGSGAPESVKLARFLARSGELQGNELTGDLRRARSNALVLDAERKDKQEAEAMDLRRKATAAQVLLSTAIKNKKLAIDAGDQALIKLLVEGGKDDERQLGAQPTPADALGDVTDLRDSFGGR